MCSCKCQWCYYRETNLVLYTSRTIFLTQILFLLETSQRLAIYALYKLKPRLLFVKVPDNVEALWLHMRPQRLPRQVSSLVVCVIYYLAESCHVLGYMLFRNFLKFGQLICIWLERAYLQVSKYKKNVLVWQKTMEIFSTKRKAIPINLEGAIYFCIFIVA